MLANSWIFWSWLIIRKLIFESFENILKYIKNLDVYPLNWQYNSILFILIKEFYSNLYNSSSEIDQIKSILNKYHQIPLSKDLEAARPGTSNSLSCSSPGSINHESEKSYFPDSDWLPITGSKLDSILDFTWIKYTFNFIVEGTSMLEKSLLDKKFEIEMHLNRNISKLFLNHLVLPRKILIRCQNYWLKIHITCDLIHGVYSSWTEKKISKNSSK